MTALKQELINCINDIPDNKLIAIKPLLYLLSNDRAFLQSTRNYAFDLANEQLL